VQPFDRGRYKREYLMPLKKVTQLPGDLLTRYAIELPATDAEIAARLKEVRAAWNQQQAGTPAAKVAMLCRAADEVLRKQHALDRAVTWQKLAGAQQEAAGEVLQELAELVRERAGAGGVITTTAVAAIATSLHVDAAAAEKAAAATGVRLIDPASVPDELPRGLPESQFRVLETSLAACETTVPHLLHPDSGSFELVDRFASAGDPSLRLDGEAVANQMAAIERRAGSAGTNAAKEALQLLRSFAASSGDLREVALVHLVKTVEGKAALGLAPLARELAGLGLVEGDAAAVAAIVADRATGAATGGAAKVEALLTEGRLREAKVAAAALGSTDRAGALATRIEEAEKRVAQLIAQARAGVEAHDEVRAEALLADAAAISLDDAEAARAATPLPPALGLTVGADGDEVRLHWRPNVGHNGVSFEIVRSETTAPATLAAGSSVAKTADSVATDARPPIAQEIHYSVFATAPGRPASRSVSASITLVPPVENTRADVGPDSVTVHWSVHPSVHAVEAVRQDAGAGSSPALEVVNNSTRISGLVEGRSVQVTVTAIYVAQDGRSLRSAPVQISATPRSEAQPINSLCARPVDVPGRVWVRVSWTPVDHSEVRIVRADRSSPWTPGTWVEPTDLTSFGQELTGHAADVRGEKVLEVVLPAGVHHLVAFSIGGTGIVVGAETSVGVTEPVTQLEATRFEGFARLSWVWPSTTDLAEVTWTVDGNQDLRKVTRVDYQRGVEIPLKSAPCTVEVRALVNFQGRTFASPGVSLTLEGRPSAELSYTVSSSPGIGRFGGRTKRVVVRSSAGCSAVGFRFIAAAGPVMPLDADAGMTLHESVLILAPGASQEFSVTVPRAVSHPYWVRGFVVGGNARLVDPPIASLKES
jgi:hypothetical protein